MDKPKLRFTDFIPGRRVELDGRVYLVSDQLKKLSTAWEHYEYDERLLVDILDGKSRWVSEMSMPDVYPVVF